MRPYLFLLIFVLLALFSAAPAHAGCDACALRAAQFWAAVEADISGTSPALADYLMRHEIKTVSAATPTYYLTPDCGAHPAQLEETLNIARDLKVHMTVFLMGSMIDRWPDDSRALLRRLVDEGHELALHSYSHRRFVDMPHEELYDEVVRNWALIDWALGYHYPIRFIRMPYGARDATVMQEISQLGLQSVFWDIDSMGWRDYATPLIVHDQVMKRIQNGSTIVLHCSAVSDRAALPTYVNDLRAMGYEPQLLSSALPRPTATDLAGYPRQNSPLWTFATAPVPPVKIAPEPRGLRLAIEWLDTGF